MSTESEEEPGSGTRSADDIERVDISISGAARPAKVERMLKVQTQKSNDAARISGKNINSYWKLLEETIKDAHNLRRPILVDEELVSTQIGLALWTGQQKEAFFRALARYGERDLPRLAAVTEKSEPEVAHYLYHLRLGLKELSSIAPDKLASKHADILATSELSEECCMFLDQAAEKLLTMETKHDADIEEKKFGEYWLLDDEIADAIEDGIAPSSKTELGREIEADADVESNMQPPRSQSPLQDSKQSSIFTAVRSASLLNLKSFLTLSESIFMNMRGPKHGWQPYTHSPGIYHSAFDDFHALATNLTRLLVHSSVYQAMTRSRALDKRDRIPTTQHRVLREDVHAAIDMLGLRRDAKKYWTTLPKRLGLRCFVNKRKYGQSVEGKRVVPKWLADSDVEKYLLGEQKAVKGRYRRESLDGVDGEPADDGSESESEDETTDGEQSDGETEEERVRKRRKLGDELEIEKLETEYLERFDQHQSRKEEFNVWRMFGRNPPTTVNLDVHIGDPPTRRPRNGDYESD